MTPMRLSLVLSVLLAPGAGFALPADFAARHGLNTQHPPASMQPEKTGFGYRSVGRDAVGNLVFTDAVMLDGGRRLGAGSLTLGENVFEASALTISGEAEGQRQGTLLVSAIKGEFPGAGRVFSHVPRICEMSEVAPLDRSVYGLRATGISMNAPALEDMGPMSASRPGVEPESLTIAGGTLAFRIGENDCLELTGADLSGISAKAVTGETSTAENLKSAVARGEDGSLRTTVDLASLDLAGRMSLAGLSATIGFGAGTIGDVVAAEGDPDLSEMLMTRGGELALALKGIDVVPADALPPAVLAGSGLANTPRISGDASLSLSLKDGTLDFAQKNDLDGLLASNIMLSLKIDGADVPLNAGALGIVSVMSLAGAEVSLKDKGLTGVIEASTGMPSADVLSFAVASAGPIPPAIAEPVVGWIGQALDAGGTVTAAPASPVPLMAIGMAAAINPAGLQSLMNVTTR